MSHTEARSHFETGPFPSEPRGAMPKVGRSGPYLCGSDKKYKRCGGGARGTERGWSETRNL